MTPLSRTVDELGFPAATADAYRRCLRAPRGLVILAGMRESGLTTTIYAGLREPSMRTRIVASVEDPVEEVLAGVRQIGLNSQRGVHFGEAIDLAMRTPRPDVLAVGLITDRRTLAKMLHHAGALLVLGGLYAETAETVPRQLADLLGDEDPALDRLVGVFAQRLPGDGLCGGPTRDGRPSVHHRVWEDRLPTATTSSEPAPEERDRGSGGSRRGA